MPFCTACGSNEPEGTVFCGQCGARQYPAESTPTQTGIPVTAAPAAQAAPAAAGSRGRVLWILLAVAGAILLLLGLYVGYGQYRKMVAVSGVKDCIATEVKRPEALLKLKGASDGILQLAAAEADPAFLEASPEQALAILPKAMGVKDPADTGGPLDLEGSSARLLGDGSVVAILTKPTEAGTVRVVLGVQKSDEWRLYLWTPLVDKAAADALIKTLDESLKDGGSVPTAFDVAQSLGLVKGLEPLWACERGDMQRRASTSQMVGTAKLADGPLYKSGVARPDEPLSMSEYPSPNEVWGEPVVTSDGTTLLSGLDTEVNAATRAGKEAFKLNLDSDVTSVVTNKRGILVAASTVGELVAAVANSGEFGGESLWKLSLDSPAVSLLPVGGTTVAVLESGSVMALGRGGSVLWETPADVGPLYDCAASSKADTVYVLGENGLAALSMATGEVAWTNTDDIATDEGGFGAVLVARDDAPVFIGTYSMVKFDSKGNSAWTFDPSNPKQKSFEDEPLETGMEAKTACVSDDGLIWVGAWRANNMNSASIGGKAVIIAVDSAGKRVVDAGGWEDPKADENMDPEVRGLVAASDRVVSVNAGIRYVYEGAVSGLDGSGYPVWTRTYPDTMPRQRLVPAGQGTWLMVDDDGVHYLKAN